MPSALAGVVPISITFMYITTVPNRHSPPTILLRESCRDGDKVRTRTLANLSAWAPERIDALRRALKGELDGFTGELQPVCGPIFAVLFTLKQLAERVGLLQVLGSERWARLVLFLILARVAAQGSRLSPVRWAPQHAVAETLGLRHFLSAPERQCSQRVIRSRLLKARGKIRLISRQMKTLASLLASRTPKRGTG